MSFRASALDWSAHASASLMEGDLDHALARMVGIESLVQAVPVGRQGPHRARERGPDVRDFDSPAPQRGRVLDVRVRQRMRLTLGQGVALGPQGAGQFERNRALRRTRAGHPVRPAHRNRDRERQSVLACASEPEIRKRRNPEFVDDVKGRRRWRAQECRQSLDVDDLLLVADDGWQRPGCR